MSEYAGRQFVGSICIAVAALWSGPPGRARFLESFQILNDVDRLNGETHHAIHGPNLRARHREGMTEQPQPAPRPEPGPDTSARPPTATQPRSHPTTPPTTRRRCAARDRRQGPPAAPRSGSARALTPPRNSTRSQAESGHEKGGQPHP
jgi:hypothetical protein